VRSHDRFASRVPQAGSPMLQGRRSRLPNAPGTAGQRTLQQDLNQTGFCALPSPRRGYPPARVLLFMFRGPPADRRIGGSVRTQGLIPAARHDVAWVKAPEQARAPGRASRRAHGWTLMQTSKEQHARPFGCKVLLDDLVSTRKER